MHHHDGTCADSNERFDERSIYQGILFCRFAKDGGQSSTTDGKYRGYISVGRDNHFIALAPSVHLAPRHQYQGEGIQSVGYTYTMHIVAIGGKGPFKLCYLLAQQIPTGGDYTMHLFGKFWLEGCGDALDI